MVLEKHLSYLKQERNWMQRINFLEKFFKNLKKFKVKIFGISLEYTFLWFNPYYLHFRDIQERHFWKKYPKFIFWSLMTSYMTHNIWRHLFLNQLEPTKHYMTQITWRHKYELSRDDNHYSRKTGNSVIYGKNPEK